MTSEPQTDARIGRTFAQVAAIAGTTVIEAVQQPIAFLLQLSAVLTTLFVPVFEFHRFSEEGRLARDSGLSCMLVFGLALAAGTAGRSVAAEIERGTAAAAIGKPVARATFVLSKWLGVFGVVAVFWCSVLASTLVAERGAAHFIVRDQYAEYATDSLLLSLGLFGAVAALGVAAALHYFWRWRFGVSAFFGVWLSQVAVALTAALFSSRWCADVVSPGDGGPTSGVIGLLRNSVQMQLPLNLRLVAGAVLVLMALAVFSALATSLATRLQTGATLAVCALVLFLGLAGDSLALGASAFSWRGAIAGVLPDMQHFWLCDALAHGGRIAWSYVAQAGAYAATCCAVFLTLGCLAFRERDLG